MIRLGNRVRLTKRKEVERFTDNHRLRTGEREDTRRPGWLRQEVQEALLGHVADTRFLHYLIDKEASGCLLDVA